MSYNDDQLLPISGLQHLAYCERQCALIHIEQAWSESRRTAEGRVMHDRVLGGEDERRGDIRIARGVRLRSLRLGLTGIADVVECHAPGGTSQAWQPFPVEYKHGRPMILDCDRVQLRAGALP